MVPGEFDVSAACRCQSPFAYSVIKSDALPPVSDRINVNSLAPQNAGSPEAALTESVKAPGVRMTGEGSFKVTN